MFFFKKKADAGRKRAERAGCDKAERWANGLREWLGLDCLGECESCGGVGR